MKWKNYIKGHSRSFTTILHPLTMTYSRKTIQLKSTNLQFLMTEIFNKIRDENPPLMKETFVMEESCYNLRSKFRLHVLRVSTTKFGLETVSFRGSQIWNALPNDFKDSECVSSFKRKINSPYLTCVCFFLNRQSSGIITLLSLLRRSCTGIFCLEGKSILKKNFETRGGEKNIFRPPRGVRGHAPPEKF